MVIYFIAWFTIASLLLDKVGLQVVVGGKLDGRYSDGSLMILNQNRLHLPLNLMGETNELQKIEFFVIRGIFHLILLSKENKE